MDIEDVNGQPIARGDWVRPSVAMVVLDPECGKLGSGQVIHVFADAIHVKYKNGIRTGNSGKCFEKTGSPDL
jgi:hypothetical protein